MMVMMKETMQRETRQNQKVSHRMNILPLLCPPVSSTTPALPPLSTFPTSATALSSCSATAFSSCTASAFSSLPASALASSSALALSPSARNVSRGQQWRFLPHAPPSWTGSPHKPLPRHRSESGYGRGIWARNCFLLVLHQKTKQEAVLKATAVRSPLPVMSLILPCPPCLQQGGGGSGGRGSRNRGVQGQGTFHPPCHIRGCFHSWLEMHRTAVDPIAWPNGCVTIPGSATL